MQAKTNADEPLAPTDKVSRFIYESDKISKSNNRPKVGAFLPELYNDRHETSVCHLDRCEESRVWHLGRSRRPTKTLHARTDFDVQHALDLSLGCLAAPEPDFDEHAVVVNWPAEKLEQKKIAVELASKAGECKAPPPVQH
ncbi:hypothetical protein [Cupriavidus sp. U2]|uniref:hypothetical protein n=1 Tax=Cupriavidus sp. U2 TaxID=2920269 RepID=UPI00129D6F5E|nr:hypothetical protein [Cupriavidus sp. U2]